MQDAESGGTNPSAQAKGERRWKAADTWMCAGLLLLTLAAFFPVMKCGFIGFDEEAYLLDNTVVAREMSWWSVKTLMMSPVMDLWHPMTTLTMHLGYQFWGLNAAGYHGLSVAMHMMCVAALYGLLAMTTGSRWRAAAVAVVFAVHPTRVESIAWVVEIKDVGSVLFALICMILYVAHVRRGGWGYGAGAVAALMLSLLYKPMFVTMPALLLLLDYWPLGRFEGKSAEQKPGAWKALVLEKWPYAVLCGGWIALTLGVGGVVGRGEHEQPFADAGQPTAMRLANVPVSYLRYMWEMVDFNDLAVHYAMRSWPAWQVIASVLVLAAISAMSVIFRRRHAMVFVGWWWFLIVLLPVIGIVRVSDYSMADRYLYFSSIGLCLAVVYAVPAKWFEARGWQVAGACACAGAISLMTSGTWQQLKYWRTPETLYARGLEVDPGNAFFHSAYAMVVGKAGRHDEALKHLLEARRLDPHQLATWQNLVVNHRLRGDTQQAIATGEEMVRLFKDIPAAYGTMAEFYAAQGNAAGMMDMLNKAVALSPQSPVWRVNRGRLFLQMGRAQDAAMDFKAALDADPTNFPAHSQLGFMFAQVGAAEEAVYHLECALASQEDFQVCMELGQQLGKLGRSKEAAQMYARAKKMETGNAVRP